MTAGCVLHVHSAPPALTPHIEWAVANIDLDTDVIGMPAEMPWSAQPAAPGMLRAEFTFQARPGAAGVLSSTLAAWGHLRFEVTEAASPGCDSIRHSCTPALGLFTAVTSANGDILVPEGRLRAAMAAAGSGTAALQASLAQLLGQAWDDELEPYRVAADRHLHSTG